MKKLGIVLVAMIFTFSIAGCAVNFYKGKPGQEIQIKKLTSQVEELEQAKRDLEERLAQEIADKQVLLQRTSRGLIISMANDILFDSGKAKVKRSANSVLERIASVLNETVPDRDIGVEGHTDNVPIQHSNWKSNWELSSSRATIVLHYLIDKCGVNPKRLSAIGYGEYRPIESNDTKAGRARNRRVEIIILPKDIAKATYEEAQSKISEEAKAAEETKTAQENIK